METIKLATKFYPTEFKLHKPKVREERAIRDKATSASWQGDKLRLAGPRWTVVISH